LEDVEHARLKVKPLSDAHDAHEDTVITEVPVEHCVVPVASTKQSAMFVRLFCGVVSEEADASVVAASSVVSATLTVVCNNCTSRFHTSFEFGTMLSSSSLKADTATAANRRQCTPPILT
jgi:hypothetical protein